MICDKKTQAFYRLFKRFGILLNFYGLLTIVFADFGIDIVEFQEICGCLAVQTSVELGDDFSLDDGILLYYIERFFSDYIDKSYQFSHDLTIDHKIVRKLRNNIEKGLKKQFSGTQKERKAFFKQNIDKILYQVLCDFIEKTISTNFNEFRKNIVYTLEKNTDGHYTVHIFTYNLIEVFIKKEQQLTIRRYAKSGTMTLTFNDKVYFRMPNLKLSVLPSNSVNFHKINQLFYKEFGKSLKFAINSFRKFSYSFYDTETLQKYSYHYNNVHGMKECKENLVISVFENEMHISKLNNGFRRFLNETKLKGKHVVINYDSFFKKMVSATEIPECSVCCDSFVRMKPSTTVMNVQWYFNNFSQYTIKSGSEYEFCPKCAIQTLKTQLKDHTSGDAKFTLDGTTPFIVFKGRMILLNKDIAFYPQRIVKMLRQLFMILRYDIQDAYDRYINSIQEVDIDEALKAVEEINNTEIAKLQNQLDDLMALDFTPEIGRRMHAIQFNIDNYQPNINACRACGQYVYRESGCNAVICQCGHKFCIVCGFYDVLTGRCECRGGITNWFFEARQEVFTHLIDIRLEPFYLGYLFDIRDHHERELE